MNSLKTTLAGIAAIATALASMIGQISGGGMDAVEWAVIIPAILAGVGLLAARDNNKTSRKAGAK